MNMAVPKQSHFHRFLPLAQRSAARVVLVFSSVRSCLTMSVCPSTRQLPNRYRYHHETLRASSCTSRKVGQVRKLLYGCWAVDAKGCLVTDADDLLASIHYRTPARKFCAAMGHGRTEVHYIKYKLNVNYINILSYNIILSCMIYWYI